MSTSPIVEFLHSISNDELEKKMIALVEKYSGEELLLKLLELVEEE